MQVNPLVHFGNNFRRSLTVHNSIQNTNTALEISVREMNVGRVVILPVQANNYSIKATNLGHNYSN